VPRVQISAGGDGGAEGGGLVQALMGLLLSEKGTALLGGPETIAARKPTRSKSKTNREEVAAE